MAAIAIEIRSALALLTRLPVAPGGTDRSGSAAFALVGAGLGTVAGLVAIPFGEERLLAAALALVVLAVASGALHLDGVADTADALVAPDPGGAERARRDPAIGAAGAAAVTLVLLVEAAALASLGAGLLLPALVVAGATSRAIPALAAPWAPRAETGFGAWFAAHSGRGGSAIALGASLAVAFLVSALPVLAPVLPPFVPAPVTFAPFVLAPVIGWAAGLGAGSAILWLVARRHGAVTGDAYGAAIEVSFAAALVGQAIAG